MPAPPSSQVSKQGSRQDVGSWSPGLPACLPVICLRPLSLLQAAHATAASHLSMCVLLTELEVRSHTSILCAVKQMQEELGRLLLRGSDRHLAAGQNGHAVHGSGQACRLGRWLQLGLLSAPTTGYKAPRGHFYGREVTATD